MQGPPLFYGPANQRDVTKPMIPKIAAKRARCGVYISLRNIRYATYINQSTNVKVSVESQDHQVPQIGRAQSGPVSNTSVQKTTPISAALNATASHQSECFQRYKILATHTRKKAKNMVMADET